MTNEHVVAAVAEPLEWPPAMTPERAVYVRGAITGIASAMLDALLADLATGTSTEDGPLQDRMMAMALRPWIPKLRRVFLDRLSEADPAGLERLMGAVATACEQILAQAPGEPLPRWRWVWPEGAARPELVPDEWRGQPS